MNKNPVSENGHAVVNKNPMFKPVNTIMNKNPMFKGGQGRSDSDITDGAGIMVLLTIFLFLLIVALWITCDAS